jgi:hypothetical protein
VARLTRRAGFTNSIDMGGDKFSTLTYFWTLAHPEYPHIDFTKTDASNHLRRALA